MIDSKSRLTKEELVIRTEKAPYAVVLYKGGEKSAVYNRSYEKISDEASSELIDYAIEGNIHATNKGSIVHEQQNPSWMTDNSFWKDCITFIVDIYEIPDSFLV